MRSRSKKFFIILLVLFLSFGAIFLSSQKLLAYPDSFLNLFVSSFTRPVWSFSGKVSHFFSSVFNIRSVYSDNDYLKDQNQRLIAENSYLKDMIKEKYVIEKARDLQDQDNFDWQIGRIIGMDTQNWSSYIIINIGNKNGIKADMPVITENKLLIGKVVEVDDGFSKVSTIFNPSMKVAVKAQDSEAFGILSGDYTKNLAMDLVTKDKALNQGEIVLTSGKDGIFPANLIIGQLKNFQIKPENLFQVANIKSDLDVYDLDRVLVITKF